MTREIYSDPNPEDPLNQPLLLDLAAVKQSFINILSIDKGEVLFASSIGGDWEKYLMREHTEETALVIYTELVETVENNDQRILILDSETIITHNYDTYKYEADIKSQVIGMGEKAFEVLGTFG